MLTDGHKEFIRTLKDLRPVSAQLQWCLKAGKKRPCVHAVIQQAKGIRDIRRLLSANWEGSELVQSSIGEDEGSRKAFQFEAYFHEKHYNCITVPRYGLPEVIMTFLGEEYLIGFEISIVQGEKLKDKIAGINALIRIHHDTHSSYMR